MQWYVSIKLKNEVKKIGRITVRKHPTEVGYQVCKNGIPVRRKYGQYTASAYFKTKKEARKYADKLRK